jgi:putative hemolysin
MARLGRVPKTADRFEWGGLQFEVVDMDGRRIDKVMVSDVGRRETGDGRRTNDRDDTPSRRE